ncbi:hypothetical protein ZHAS_00003058 [Anopheles sinensis]|uniref:Uncharacterized protein n=1 Tax=Anopheles sinensis TaxID=74873 RepID=A0A084VDJ3_ANOSI|nr:hypothetical protein ZHAS_00003058 [Anopheles sinensis]
MNGESFISSRWATGAKPHRVHALITLGIMSYQQHTRHTLENTAAKEKYIHVP